MSGPTAEGPVIPPRVLRASPEYPDVLCARGDHWCQEGAEVFTVEGEAGLVCRAHLSADELRRAAP